MTDSDEHAQAEPRENPYAPPAGKRIEGAKSLWRFVPATISLLLAAVSVWAGIARGVAIIEETPRFVPAKLGLIVASSVGFL
ncbi:hypothetical protein Pan216_22390 [Planctomycetes bacterium Pan216]|uniref:Uncharacterized protein n=1 Tax=Kolteria novifilia TaxID=2527975 RepID=A0A518B315_9BACT|nr:hypothetical protein Pan216_22390 [Planctomycetes bacterium Pan216]